MDTTAFGARLTQDERPRDANQLVEFGLGLCISFLDTCDVLLLYCISRGLAGLKLQLVFAVYRLQVLLQVYLGDAIISHSCCLIRFSNVTKQTNIHCTHRSIRGAPDSEIRVRGGNNFWDFCVKFPLFWKIFIYFRILT